MSDLLVYSSLLFVSNFIHARIRGYYIYSSWFYLLTITSIIIHGFYPENFIVNLIDKIPIVGIIVTGFNLFVNKVDKCSFITRFFYTLIVLSSFLFVIYIFYYGYFTNNFCFHSDKFKADMFHTLLHLASSVGHHAIIIM